MEKGKDGSPTDRSVSSATPVGLESALTLGKAAVRAYEIYPRDIGCFDYSQGKRKLPYVIRDFRRNPQTIFETDDRVTCETEWQRTIARYVGEAVLKAARSESEDTQAEQSEGEQ